MGSSFGAAAKSRIGSSLRRKSYNRDLVFVQEVALVHDVTRKCSTLRCLSWNRCEQSHMMPVLDGEIFSILSFEKYSPPQKYPFFKKIDLLCWVAYVCSLLHILKNPKNWAIFRIFHLHQCPDKGIKVLTREKLGEVRNILGNSSWNQWFKPKMNPRSDIFWGRTDFLEIGVSLGLHQCVVWQPECSAFPSLLAVGFPVPWNLWKMFAPLKNVFFQFFYLLLGCLRRPTSGLYAPWKFQNFPRQKWFSHHLREMILAWNPCEFSNFFGGGLRSPPPSSYTP